MAAQNELRLLSRAIRDRDITRLLEAKVTTDWFVDPDNARLWDFVVEHYQLYGEVPTSVTVKDNFPVQRLLNVEDTIGYLLDQLIAFRRAKAVTDMVRVSIEAIEENEHEAAIAVVRSRLAELDRDHQPGSYDNIEHLAFERDVETEMRRLEVRQCARERFASAVAPAVAPFDAGCLREILDRAPEPPFRIEELQPSGGSMLVVAQRKTGKTTFELNLARCLLTGEPFLDRFEVRPVAGTVGLLNFEVSGAPLAKWADDIGVDDERLLLVNLRGCRNPLSSLEHRERLIELLVRHSVSTLIIDPFGRAFSGTNQNDAGEVGAWLADLDRFVADAGAIEVILSAHAGWSGERTRGSTALEDWADSIVTLVRDKDDESRRFLSAIGRAVDVAEDQLTYDPSTRLLRLSGSGSRRAAGSARRLEELVGPIVDLVIVEPGIGVGQIGRRLREHGVSFGTNDESKAATLAVSRGLLHVITGPRRAKLHYPGPGPAVSPLPPESIRGDSDDPLHHLSIGGEGHRSRSVPDYLRPGADLMLDQSGRVRSPAAIS